MFYPVSRNQYQHQRGSRQERHAYGSSFVELAIGMMALIPIAISALDLCVIIIGVQTNDAVCRESARVAGTGDPRDAQQRVNKIVDNANYRAPFKCKFKVITVSSTVGERDIKALSPLGGPVRGTMTVETQVDVTTNLVHMIYSGKTPLTFQANQTFPMTYMVPPGQVN